MIPVILTIAIIANSLAIICAEITLHTENRNLTDELNEQIHLNRHLSDEIARLTSHSVTE